MTQSLNFFILIVVCVLYFDGVFWSLIINFIYYINV